MGKSGMVSGREAELGGKGEFHSRGSFAVTLLDTADVWCSKLPLAVVVLVQVL